MSAADPSTVLLRNLGRDVEASRPSSPVDVISPGGTPTEPQNDGLQPTSTRRQVTVLVSAFLTICITIGMNQSYGIFQSFYTSSNQDMLPVNAQASSALIAFVGTLGAGLTWGGSVFVNPLMTRVKDIRVLPTVGVIAMSLGYGLASCSTQIWHLLLTQGLLYGIGSSLMYFPILSVAPEYFNQHRGLAVGFILSGAGAGGLVFSPVTRALLSFLGGRWTLRALALIILVVSMPIALTAAPTRFSGRRPTHVNVHLALKPVFIFSVMAAFLQAGGNLLPLTFLPSFSTTLGFSSSSAALLLALSNAVNSSSRVVTGHLGDRYGRQNTLILMMIMSFISVVTFWLSSASAGSGTASERERTLWICFVVFYGIAGGGYNALFPTTVSDVFGLQAYASVSGFMYFVRGLGAMMGSPVGGQILGSTGDIASKRWRNVVWFDAALLGLAAISILGVRGFDAVDKRHWRWRA